MKIKKPKPSEICPPGYHIVRGHPRRCESGTKTWVDTHPRRNRGKKLQMLLGENLLYLWWNSKKKYKKLGAIKGYKENAELDAVIQFWIEYWRKQGLAFPAVDPKLIKALVAVESTFDPKASSTNPKSTAYGLMQITDQTRRILGGIPDGKGYREMPSHYIQLSRADLEDPVISIGAGTRWLFYKYTKIPKRAKKTLSNTIKNYHSWDDAGEAYMRKVEALYQKSK